jgi:hypothetical protein
MKTKITPTLWHMADWLAIAIAMPFMFVTAILLYASDFCDDRARASRR